LIASGVKVAFGAPCFFGTGDVGAGVEEDSGVTVGDGVTLGDFDPSGVAVSSGVGEDFFFRPSDGVGDGEAEGFFFLIDGVTDGAGDSSLVGEGFFFGEAAGEGDGLFVVEELFFLRGFGVGVGVERILLIVLASDCSAAPVGATVETASARVNRARTSIMNGLTD